MNSTNKIVGLIPAAGSAQRIAPLPFSKELFPVGLGTCKDRDGLRPKPVCHYLLDAMRFAGVDTSYIVINNTKFDIPKYLGNGNNSDLSIAYLLTEKTEGVPFTLAEAYPFVKDSTVVFGFPDILFSPVDGLQQLLLHKEETENDVVLGLFPTNNPQKMDMVEIHDNQVTNIIIKPKQRMLTHTWIIAVWGPRFSKLLWNYTRSNTHGNIDHHLGDVIKEALETDMKVGYRLFNSGKFLDIGTQDDLIRSQDPRFIEKIIPSPESR